MKRFKIIGVVASLVIAPTVAIGSATPAQAAPSGVCTGVTNCKVVKSVDITGDGVKDSVGIVTHPIFGDYYASVRVLTGKGTLLTYTDGSGIWPYSEGIFRGAAPIDGRPGADVVIGNAAAAYDGTRWLVVGYRHHKLVKVNAPKLPKKVGIPNYGWWMTASNDDWRKDYKHPTVKIVEGIKRTTHHGKAQVELTVATRAKKQHKYDTWTVTYRWNGHGWHRVSTKHRKLSKHAATALSGWHLT